MGKEKYQKKIKDLFLKSPVVKFSSIERIVKNKKNVRQYTKQLIRNLILKKGIYKIGKGVYTKYDDPSLAVFCFDGYLGLQDALSFHNLWEQETIPVIITVNKVRQGIRKILGLNVLIRRIDRRYFFGFDYVKSGDFYFPYSDIEKTFIDLVYFKQPLDKELLKEFRRRIDKKKLKQYLVKYPKRFRKKVIDTVNI